MGRRGSNDQKRSKKPQRSNKPRPTNLKRQKTDAKKQLSGPGVPMITLEQLKTRVLQETNKASQFKTGLGLSVVVPTDGDDIFMPKPNIDPATNQFTMTPNKILLGNDVYDMADATELLNKARMTKLLSQMSSVAKEGRGSIQPLSNYSISGMSEVDKSSSAPSLENNAPIVSRLSEMNVSFIPRIKSTSDPGASDINFSANVLDQFPKNRASEVECILNHFIDPREHLGKKTHFILEDLLTDDQTKSECGNCTIEALDIIADIDLSSLSKVILGNQATKQVNNLTSNGARGTPANMLGRSTQTIANTDDTNLMENIFEEEVDVPFQLEGLELIPNTSAAGPSGTWANTGPSLSVYMNLIQYIDIFTGYEVSRNGKKLMKSSIFEPLSQDLMATLETAAMPVLCRFRPFHVKTEEELDARPTAAENSLMLTLSDGTDAMPIFNSCFLIAPGELSDYASIINPSVLVDLYTEGCDYYFLDNSDSPVDYQGYYHVHYDGTIMSEATHNPNINHNILYAYAYAGDETPGAVFAEDVGCPPKVMHNTEPTQNQSSEGSTDTAGIVRALNNELEAYYRNGGHVQGNAIVIS
jgi:hypothetical protein